RTQPAASPPTRLLRPFGSTSSFSSSRDGAHRRLARAMPAPRQVPADPSDASSDGGLEDLRTAPKLEHLAVLAGGVAHDFNTLLVSVLGNAERALSTLPVDSPVRTQLERIELAGRRAADLSRQMLSYAGRAESRASRVNLTTLAGEILCLLEA